jgi:hypothetical protein
MQDKKPGVSDAQNPAPSSAPGTRRPDAARGKQKRGAPRFPLPVRAVVEIPGLPPREYGVCEVSRSGMFLAFLDARETRPEFEQSGNAPGVEIAISFEVMLPDASYHCDLPARVVRTTHSGIGVEVAEPHRAELDALIARLPTVRHAVGRDSA